MPELLSQTEEQTIDEQEKLIDGSGGPPPEDFDDGGEGWYPNRTPQSTYAIGMLVGCAASSMFFLALVSAAVVHKGMPGSDWMALQVPSILWVTSSLAIASSITMTQSRRMFKRRDCSCAANSSRGGSWKRWAYT
jgi:hypothetical protein